MKNKLLKTSLFGFSKTSICEYIAKVNDEFNTRLKETEDAHQKKKEALERRIAELTAELDRYHQMYSDISAPILDARKYADAIRSQADSEYKMAKDALEELISARTKAVHVLDEDIEILKKELESFVYFTLGQFETFSQKTVSLKEKYAADDGKP